MADTLGSLIDKLFTIDTKMWNNQEEIYKIRKMDFEQYKQEYFTNEEGAKRLWDCLKRATDLNVQRNQLIDEIDQKVINMISEAAQGKELDDGKNIQRKHKTY
jgi:RNAse (barnase) inhibitor barstar